MSSNGLQINTMKHIQRKNISMYTVISIHDTTKSMPSSFFHSSVNSRHSLSHLLMTLKQLPTAIE